MNAVNAENIREAADYLVGNTGTLPPTLTVLRDAALAYASLLDGTHPEMMLIHRNAPSIKVTPQAARNVAPTALAQLAAYRRPNPRPRRQPLPDRLVDMLRAGAELTATEFSIASGCTRETAAKVIARVFAAYPEIRKRRVDWSTGRGRPEVSYFWLPAESHLPFATRQLA